MVFSNNKIKYTVRLGGGAGQVGKLKYLEVMIA